METEQTEVDRRHFLIQWNVAEHVTSGAVWRAINSAIDTN